MGDARRVVAVEFADQRLALGRPTGPDVSPARCGRLLAVSTVASAAVNG